MNGRHKSFPDPEGNMGQPLQIQYLPGHPTQFGRRTRRLPQPRPGRPVMDFPKWRSGFYYWIWNKMAKASTKAHMSTIMNLCNLQLWWPWNSAG